MFYGINHVKPKYTVNGSVHAENDVMRKLPVNKKRLVKKINMIVIQINKDGELRNSKPCVDCIARMKKIMIKKNYEIKYVYFSNNNGIITKMTFDALEKDEIFHVSKYMRNK